MERLSPPTRRVVAVFDALSAAPGLALSLSELATLTDMSKATCLGVLNELTNAGYLMRVDDRKYQLGPSLLGVASAAQRGNAVVELARPHLQKLAQDLNVAATISAVIDDHITILARAGDDKIAQGVRIGGRYPFAPPAGVMFVAWDSDAVVDEWLAKDPLAPLSPDPVGLKQVVEACRRRGFLMEGLHEVNTELYALLEEVFKGDLPTKHAEAITRLMNPILAHQYVTSDPQPGDTVAISEMCAPAFGADGKSRLLVGMFLMRADISYDEVQRYSGALLETTRTLTEALGGRDPWREFRG